ncbi:hypothetical protein AVEN_243961-1, partial [Araneus ventricosus]
MSPALFGTPLSAALHNAALSKGSCSGSSSSFHHDRD